MRISGNIPGIKNNLYWKKGIMSKMTSFQVDRFWSGFGLHKGLSMSPKYPIPTGPDLDNSRSGPFLNF